MQRVLTLIVAAALLVSCAAVLSGCAKQPQTPETPQEEAVTIRVGGLKGPTSMGLVKLLDDAEQQVKLVLSGPDGEPVEEDFADGEP